ncbi:hypothetical protein ABK040_013142 [Willaertia magna]
MSEINNLSSSMMIHSIIKQLPKIELHSHLGGCIREETIKELIFQPKFSSHFTNPNEILKQVQVLAGDQRSLNQCFKLFDIISFVTNDLQTIERITYETLQDYDKENCIYLELRTTPKSLQNIYSKKDYLNSILKTINKYLKENKENTNFIDIGLIVSVNRGLSKEEAKENIELAKELYQLSNDNQSKEELLFSGIVGIDLSGNCFKNHFKDFIEYFNNSNLNQTIHFAEIENVDECKLMLEHCHKVLPKNKVRLGHAVCLNKELKDILKVDIDDSVVDSTNKEEEIERIPVEICITSNLMCKSVVNLHDHPFVMFYKSNHPVSLNTDDRGVFQTTLEEEYLKAYQILEKLMKEKMQENNNEDDSGTCEISKVQQVALQELIKVLERSLDGIFANEKVIEKVKKEFRERMSCIITGGFD